MAAHTPTPYGSWPSPVTTDVVLSSAVNLVEARVSPDKECVGWLEGRPEEKGRNALVVLSLAGGEKEDERVCSSCYIGGFSLAGTRKAALELRRRMFRLLPLFLALSSLAAAQSLPSGAPQCVINCFQTKLSEADYLAPGVGADNIAGLCATETFVAAYRTCLSDHCSGDDQTTGQALAQQICNVGSATASAASSASSVLAGASSSFDSAAAAASSSLASLSASASSALGEAANATASAAESLSSVQASLTSDLGSAAASASSSLQSELSNAASSASSAASGASSSAASAASSASSAAQPTASGSEGQGSEGGDNAAPSLAAGSTSLALLATAFALTLAA
ncbi:hypothetical protein JCM6882_001405 [Rhodosporidiobolus microsporus]